MRIAIDGPSASGKTVIGNRLAHHFGAVFFDTGLTYRAVAFRALAAGVALSDTAALKKIVADLKIYLEAASGYRAPAIMVKGCSLADLTGEGTDEIGQYASKVSAIADVRRLVVRLQKEAAMSYAAIVTVGRDIGAVIMQQDADIKLFLAASDQTRARRRYGEEYRDKLPLIVERDARDAARAVSPLAPAPGAVVIDTEGREVSETVQHILSLIEERADASH